MGSAGSVLDTPIYQVILDEFEKLKKLHHLTTSYEEILKFEIPNSIADDIDLLSLGVIWKLDSNKDGLISEEDTTAFAEFVNEEKYNCSELDFKRKIDGICGAEFLDAIDNDESGVIEWVMRLIDPPTRFGFSSPLVPQESIQLLYRILVSASSQSEQIDVHAFFALLKQGENELKIRNTDACSVHRDVLVKIFMPHFLQSYQSLISTAIRRVL